MYVTEACSKPPISSAPVGLGIQDKPVPYCDCCNVRWTKYVDEFDSVHAASSSSTIYHHVRWCLFYILQLFVRVNCEVVGIS
jgi:hypothetical protein